MFEKFKQLLRVKEGEIDSGLKDQSEKKGTNKNKYLIFVIGLVLLFGLALSGLSLFDKPKPSTILFSLAKEKGASLTIAKKEKLILKSNYDFAPSDLNKLLVIRPATQFKIQKKTKWFSFLHLAKAETEDLSLSNEFEIIPEQDLSEGKIVNIEIAKSSDFVIDHDYSWAFQVEAPFQMISSFPGNEARDVPLNIGIELTFNRDKLINIENSIVFEPALKGKFENNLTNVTFVPEGDLQEKTIYKVTVKKGLGYEAGQGLTESDFSFSFETRSRENEESNSRANWSRDYFQFRPGAKSFLNFYVPDSKMFPYDPVGATPPEITIYKFQNSTDFRSEYFRFTNLAYKWSNWKKEIYAPEKAPIHSSFVASVIKKDWQYMIEAPETLENGYYVFEMKIQDDISFTFVQKSPIAFYYSLLNTNGLIWLYDYENKKPAEGMEIKFFSKDGDISLGKTNNDGLLEFDTPAELQAIKDKIVETPVYFEAEKNGLPNYVIISSDTGLVKQDKFWNFLSCDRPIYQIKDKINYWGVAKGRDTDLTEKKLSVGLYSTWMGGDDPLVASDVLVTPFDTFSGNLSYAGIDPGYYYLIAKYNDEVVSQVSVQIFAYTKPMYKLEVKSDRENYWVGDEVTFKVSASFFDGTALSGQKLNYNISWRDGQNNPKEIVLDEKGEATVRYKPEYFFDDTENNWTYYPRSLHIDFSPAMAEEAQISGAKDVSVYGPDIYLQSSSAKIEQDKYRFEARVNKIDINSNDYIGLPEAGQSLSAKIVKYYYVETLLGETYDPIYKVKVKNYSYDIKTEEVETLQGITGADGKWIFEKNLKTIESGWYIVNFSGEDKNKRQVRSQSYSGYEVFPDGDLSLSLKNTDLEKAASGYKIGDAINFTTLKQGKGVPIDNKILYYRYTDKIGKAEVTSAETLDDVFAESYVPSLRFTAVIAGPEGFLESGSELVQFDSNEHKLDIDIKTDKEKYRPKEKIKVELNVKDKSKNNIKAAINVASVDEAIFNVVPYSFQGEILDSLYAPLSSWPVSKATVFFSKNNGAEKGGCFIAGTMILTEQGEEPIESIHVGDVVLTKNSEKDINLKPAIVQGISNHLVHSYITINKKLNLTIEHVIFLNGKWQEAGKAKLGDDLLGLDGNIIKVRSIDLISADNTRVYNILVGKYHTYFASDIYVHNAEKGGGGDTRTNFIDVPLYTEVMSDEKGYASVEFTAPDNITSWRLTANAYDAKKMLAGSNYGLIPVGLPLFTDIVLNKFYLAGDAPILKLRAFGTGLRNDLPIEFTLKCPELALDKVVVASSSEIEVPIGTLKEGDYKISLSAKQGSLNDTVQRDLHVVDNYFRQGQTSATKVADGQAQIKGNEGGFTNVAFVDTGVGKYFADIVSLSYSGDLRSDRYVASFYGRKLLEKYFGKKTEEENLDLSAYYKNGLSLFPYGDDNLELTAKLADLSKDYLSTNFIKTYLNSVISDNKADIRRISIALYGLASLGEPILDMVDSVKNSDKLDDESRLYLGLALVKIGARESAREMYSEISNKFVEYKGGLLFKTSEDQNNNMTLTAMTALLSSYLNEENDLEKLWMVISTNDNTKIAIELEKIMIISNELVKRNKEQITFSYKTLSGSGDADLSEGKNFSLYLSDADLKSLTFANVKGEASAISFFEEGIDPKSLAPNSNLSISRKYLLDKKEATELREGSLVLVSLKQKINDKLADTAYQIVDYLPAGLKPVTEVYQPYFQADEACDPIWYPSKIIDNAVYFSTGKWFQKTDKCSERTMNYYARVVNKGEFRAQPAIIQSIESTDILNISDEKNITIK